MKKVWFAFFGLLSLELLAQQAPNSSFEDWEDQLGGTYEEPGGNWWATLNFLRGFGSTAPITVNRTTDAYAGQYAAEITTGQFGSFTVPGILVSGDVGEINLQNPTDVIMRGKPFTAKPQKFSGYHKHLPVNGDSAVANAMLTRYNTSTQQRDTIALAEQLFKTPVNSYSPFEADFIYYLPNVEPDSIIIALVSSAGGQNLAGQPGSKLFVDALTLDYASGIRQDAFSSIEVKTYPNPCVEKVIFDLGYDAINHQVAIYNQLGKLVHVTDFEGPMLKLDLAGWPTGSYLYAISCNSKVVSTGTLVKKS